MQTQLDPSVADGDAVAILDRVRSYAMPDGPVETAGTWLRQRGEMRMDVDGPWMPFTAEQWFEGSGVDFRWRAWVRMGGLLPTLVVDSFERGRGGLTARVLGLVPVASSRGPETDRGEALRGLAELPWRPFAFRAGPPFTWKATATNTLRATFDDGETRASVDFQVDADGRAVGAVASSRPRLVGKSFVDTPWFATVSEYRTFGRLRVPSQAEAAWQLPRGPFTYWRGQVTDFKTFP
jgi:hypothetical protein